MINKRILAVIVSAVFATGCTVTEAYSTAATANDVTLEAATVKLCTPLSTVSANRTWTEEQLAARDLLCQARIKQ